MSIFELFPLAGWLAVVTSIVLFVSLRAYGELQGARHVVAVIAWLVAAGYLQFFGPTAIVAAVGLVMQTLLAVYLIAVWRWTS